MGKGARYTPRGSFGSIYLGSDPITSLCEVVAVFRNPHGPAITLRMPPWAVFAVDGVLSDVIDLTDASNQTQLGTNLTELTGDWAYVQATGQIPPTQILAQAAYDAGTIVGIKYESAKNLGAGFGLVVFSDRLTAHPPSHLQVIDPHNNLTQRIP